MPEVGLSFEKENTFLAQKQQAVYTAASKTTPNLPPGADQILTRALDPDPEKRYHTGAELAADVDQLPEPSPGTA